MVRIKALVDGVWHGRIEETPELRERLSGVGDRFRNWVTTDGAPGPSGTGGFRAGPGRYHLYVSHACPFAHRTILYRRLKRLEAAVSMSVVHPRWATDEGWVFGETEWSTPDHVHGEARLEALYRRAWPEATTRVTVPVLWDRERDTIVSVESSDIMRMLDGAFDAWADTSVDFRPEDLRGDIDEMNEFILSNVCLGVYKAGFARSQADYDQAVKALFEALDFLEDHFARRTYLLGNRVTESDWHLFTALVRFDVAYHGKLRCNRARLIDYPALSGYAKRLHDLPGVADTVRLDQITRHYNDDLTEIDPTIVPVGPRSDFRDGPAVR